MFTIIAGFKNCYRNIVATKYKKTPVKKPKVNKTNEAIVSNI